MFSRIRNLLTASLVVLAFAAGTVSVALQPSLAGAAPVDVLEKCDSQSKVCKGKNTEDNSLYALIRNIINLLLMAIGIISVIMIIIGGIRYATSAGDAGQARSARDTIIYAIVGLVVAVMSYALVNWVLGQL